MCPTKRDFKTYVLDPQLHLTFKAIGKMFYTFLLIEQFKLRHQL